MVFTGLIVLTLFNGLIFLPVLLVLVGPPAEFIPNGDNSDDGAISDPAAPETGSKSRHIYSNRSHQKSSSMPNTIKINNKNGLSHSAKGRGHHQSDLSLSTIAEESGSYASNTCHEPCYTFPMTTSQSLNGTSVKVEPTFTVETTTHPSNHVS